MRIDIITLFPEMCEAVLSESIIGRAVKKGAVEIVYHQLRDFAFDKHRRVDDTPYGGGMGMVMKCEPIALCFEALCDELGFKPHLIYMSPAGRVLNQSRVRELACEYDNICILCGHYEGVDQRDFQMTNALLRKATTTDCLNIPSIQSLLYGVIWKFLPFFCRDITPMWKAGVKNSLSYARKSCVPICWKSTAFPIKAENNYTY